MINMWIAERMWTTEGGLDGTVLLADTVRGNSNPRRYSLEGAWSALLTAVDQCRLLSFGAEWRCGRLPDRHSAPNGDLRRARSSHDPPPRWDHDSQRVEFDGGAAQEAGKSSDVEFGDDRAVALLVTG